MERTCAVCSSNIGKCTYRNVEKDPVYQRYMVEVGLPTVGLLCGLCVTRCNRLNKIDIDLETKIDRLRSARQEILSDLKLKANILKTTTPTKQGKRLLQRMTPTPKAIKKFQPDRPKTSARSSLFSEGASHNNPSPKQLCSPLTRTENKTTQTHIDLERQEPFEVKIVIKYGNKHLSSIVKDPQRQKLCKAVFNKQRDVALLRYIHKDAILEAVCTRIRFEVCTVCRKDESLFKFAAARMTTQVAWSSMWEEIGTKLPALHGIIESATVKDSSKGIQKAALPVMCMSSAVMMFCRNPLLSHLPTTFGLILDAGGLTKECINMLNAVGVTVSYPTIRRRRKALVKSQEAAVRQTLHDYKQSVTSDTMTRSVAGAERPDMDQHTGQSSEGTDIPRKAEGAERPDMDQHTGQSSEGTDIPRKAEGAERPDMKQDKVQSSEVPKVEILGDNVDVMISPGTLTKERQRKSLHWFLTLVTEKRVTDMTLPCHQPKADIKSIDTSLFIPSSMDIVSLQKDLVFHTAHVILRNIEHCQSIKGCLPKDIHHQYLKETSQKSKFYVSDLIDASENSSEGMIKIMREVENVAVPHTEGKGVVQRVVFGGDVLTNERAFSAQEALQNASNDMDGLTGIIHRPEGLHREMNFLSSIYQLFYKEKSSSDKGSLYNLRNILNRRDVTGPDAVKVNFRSHYKFVQDVVDGYLVAAFLNLHDLDDCSSCKNLPVFSLMTKDEQKSWLLVQAQKVLSSLQVTDTKYLDRLREEMAALNAEDKMIEDLSDGSKFACPICGKNYVRQAMLRSHLSKIHKWEFTKTSSPGESGNPLQCFLQMGLLLRDTYDAYRMCDGNRVFRNATFEWLYAGSTGHTKYKLWLWRMQAYEKAILSEREAHEYKWNVSVSNEGGVGNNIPNDNCVELHVQKIKKELLTQGANKSFDSAKQIAMSVQTLDKMTTEMRLSCKVAKSSGKRPDVDKKPDIAEVVRCVRHSVQWKSFGNFKDPLSKVDGVKLHGWIQDQKKVADHLMH